MAANYNLPQFAWLLLTVIITIALFEVLFADSITTIGLNNWLMTIEWSFLFDELTLLMLLPIMSVSMLVQLYSFGYMSNDQHLARFMSYLSLFTFAIMTCTAILVILSFGII